MAFVTFVDILSRLSASLIDLALKLYPAQVKEHIFGFLPLHLAVACPSCHPPCEKIDKDDTYCINKILSVFPEAAKERDKSGQLPLHMAVEGGKSWENVVRTLFKAFPFAPMELDGRHTLFPFMLAAAYTQCDFSLVHDRHLTTIFELLAASPTLVLQPH